MLNYIWCFFILIAVFYSIIMGNFPEVNNSIFSSIQSTVELCVSLLGAMCFWSGIMNIIANTSIQQKLQKAIKPINNFLFPKLNKDSKAYHFISIIILPFISPTENRNSCNPVPNSLAGMQMSATLFPSMLHTAPLGT